MQLETKYMRLRTPVTIGSRFGDWRRVLLGQLTRHARSERILHLTHDLPAATPVLKVTAGLWSVTDCRVDADWDRSSVAVADIPADYCSSAVGDIAPDWHRSWAVAPDIAVGRNSSWDLGSSFHSDRMSRPGKLAARVPVRKNKLDRQRSRDHTRIHTGRRNQKRRNLSHNPGKSRHVVRTIGNSFRRIHVHQKNRAGLKKLVRQRTRVALRKTVHGIRIGERKMIHRMRGRRTLVLHPHPVARNLGHWKNLEFQMTDFLRHRCDAEQRRRSD